MFFFFVVVCLFLIIKSHSCKMCRVLHLFHTGYML